MGPSPTIPTSFVPKQPVRSAARFTRSGTNIFMVIALFMLVLSLVAAAGVFAYGEYLKGVAKAKAAKLGDAQTSIDTDAVEEFVRSRDRFSAASDILNKHVAASGFFSLLESVTLANVRFSTLTFERLADGSGKVEMQGSARSFNALAAQSAAFSAEKRIKRAIFSDIQVSPTGTVSFSLTADIDARLLAFALDPSKMPAPAAPTLPAAPVESASTSATTTTP